MGPTTGMTEAARATPQGGEEPEEIRAQIEQTRAEMAETIDAIQAKLNPDYITAQVKETVRTSTARRAEQMANTAERKARNIRSTISETIRENPIPAAMAGIGIGWLLMKSSSGPSSSQYRPESRMSYRYYPESREGSMTDEMQYRARQMANQVQDTAGRARDEMGQTIDEAQHRASELASEAQDRAGELADQAREQVSHFTDQAQYQAEQATDRFQQMLDENPLAVGAMALAAGAAIGLMVPETRRERELMGEARDTLMEKAQETAEETVRKVQNVAEQAGQAAQQAAKDEANKQGLTGA